MERWWIYDGEMLWREGGASLRLRHAGRVLWSLDFFTAGESYQVRCDVAAGGTFEWVAGKPAAIESDLMERAKRALFRSLPFVLTEHGAQYVVDVTVRANLESRVISYRRLRYDLINAFHQSENDANGLLSRLEGRYIDRRGANAYATSLALCSSDLAQSVERVVASALQTYLAEYPNDPDMESVSVDRVLRDAQGVGLPNASNLKILEIFGLGRPSDPSRVEVPADIEKLVLTKVDSLASLWAYAERHQSVPRPWPLAAEKQAVHDDGPVVASTIQQPPIGNELQHTVRASSQLVALELRQPVTIGPKTLSLPVSQPDAETGMQVNSWKVEGRIGRGAFGVVYECEHTVTGKRSAIKIIPQVDVESAHQFEREAKSLGDLTHPGLPEVYDAGTIPGQRIAYIVTRLLRGQSFDSLLRDGWRATQRDAVALLIGILDPLSIAHDRGIVHRDIKPSNLYLEQVADKRQVVLLDFGCAKLWGAMKRTRTNHQPGTMAYMAPETYSGQLSSASDLWSVGITLYELMTGSNPYDSESPAETMNKIVNGAAPQLPLGNAVIAALLDRMLQKSAEARPSVLPTSSVRFAKMWRRGSRDVFRMRK